VLLRSACRACTPGYYRSQQNCVVCPQMGIYYLLIFVVALLGAGLLAAWMQRSGVNLKGDALRCFEIRCVGMRDSLESCTVG
jgi:hypothetical protein